MSEQGYSDEVYKLAVLTGQQREDLVARLKPMPGHKAKLTAFFTVIDEVSPLHTCNCVCKIFPRSVVIDQIKAGTPDQRGTKFVSPPRQRVPVVSGPQKTLLQKYE